MRHYLFFVISRDTGQSACILADTRGEGFVGRLATSQLRLRQTYEPDSCH